MIRTQRWQPDTCAAPGTLDCCTIIESWDDSLPPETRMHDFVAFERICSRHSAAHGANHQAAFAANYEENQRKNVTWAIAKQVGPAFADEDFSFSFDSAGVLTVTFNGKFNTTQKNQLRSRCDVQFGAGKVRVP